MTPLAVLYVLTSRVDGFAGWGAATIQWLRAEQIFPPAPYVDLIADYQHLAPESRAQAERAVCTLFSGDEVAALHGFFQRAHPALAQRLQPGALHFPLVAEELVALVEAEPDPDAARCLVRLPADGPLPPFPIQGIAAPWPWPDLEPADVARLTDLRERLGHDPAPPLPGSARGA